MAPIDTKHRSDQLVRVNKKPHKVEETGTPYTAKKPVKAAAAMPKAEEVPQIRYIDPETARKLTKDILDKHHDLFRRLAQ